MRMVLSGSPFWVSTTADSGAGSLRDAIEQANANPGKDTIKFRTAADETINLTSQLLITDDLVIDGPGAEELSVSGQESSRVFLVLPAELADDPFVAPSSAQLETAPEVNFRNLTISDGLATDAPGVNPFGGTFGWGGGITNVGGAVHLEGVEMTGNRSEGLAVAGGAVANTFGGTLTVNRSHFAENSADATLFGVGGAIYSDAGQTVESFSVEGSGDAQDGLPFAGQPARDHSIDEGTLTIGDTTLAYTGEGSVQTFSQDFSTGTGTFGSADPFVFTDEDGDQLVTYYGRTDKGAAEDGTFALLPAEFHPDGLPFDSGDLFVHFIAEFVVQPESTGKYAGSSGSWIMDAYTEPFSPTTDIDPTGINVEEYRWESRGDVQLVFPTDRPEVDIDRSSFENNTASAQLGHIPGEAFTGLGGAGAVLNVNGLMSIDRSTFTGNSVQGGNGIGGAAKGGPGFGGAIISSNGSPFATAQSVLEVQRSTFVNNEAVGGNGGDTGAEGGEAGGGAINIVNGGEGQLERNVFEGNTAIGGNGVDGASGGNSTGGALGGSAGATLTLKRDSFSGNSVDGGASDGGAGGVGRGGAFGIFSIDLTGWIPGLSGTADVNRAVFTGNTATGGMGGGIYSEGELTITHGIISDNTAQGRADANLPHAGVFSLAGSAAGGGIANLGDMSLINSHVNGNSAVGADDTVRPFFQFPLGPTFSGTAFGGGIYNPGTAMIATSHFRDNAAVAGDRGVGDFPGTASGGAIINDGALNVSGTTFQGNWVVGGSETVAAAPLSHNGHALGGAITSGTLLPAVGSSATSHLEISRSKFDGNQAIGGDNNQLITFDELGDVIPLPEGAFVPRADGPSNAFGGGIVVYQGSVEMERSFVTDNIAQGGTGGANFSGSLGVGGGIFLFDFLGGIDAELERVHVQANSAIGGSGSEDTAGGDGIGGGIAVGSLESLFAGPGSASINRSHVSQNEALGGEGSGSGSGGLGLGGGIAIVGGSAEVSSTVILRNEATGGAGGDADAVGGDGRGGGVFNDEDGATRLLRSIVIGNTASGGHGGGIADDGTGEGGGIYNMLDGLFVIDSISEFLTRWNNADVGDDILGDLITL